MINNHVIGTYLAAAKMKRVEFTNKLQLQTEKIHKIFILNVYMKLNEVHVFYNSFF